MSDNTTLQPECDRPRVIQTQSRHTNPGIIECTYGNDGVMCTRATSLHVLQRRKLSPLPLFSDDFFIVALAGGTCKNNWTLGLRKEACMMSWCKKGENKLSCVLGVFTALFPGETLQAPKTEGAIYATQQKPAQ